MVGLKNGLIYKNLTKMVNPRAIAGNAEEEEEDILSQQFFRLGW